MGTVHITYRSLVSLNGSALASRQPRTAATITSSGTSQATSITALQGEAAIITATTAVFVAVGASPTAASGAGDLVPAGGIVTLAGLRALDKVAVIDA